MARPKQTVQAKKRVTRRRHHGREATKALERGHHPLLDSAATGLLHLIDDEAVAPHAEARQRERRTRQVPAEALPSEVVVRGKMHARVQVEALVHGGIPVNAVEPEAERDAVERQRCASDSHSEGMGSE